jgi:hypothetical protein
VLLQYSLHPATLSRWQATAERERIDGKRETKIGGKSCAHYKNRESFRVESGIRHCVFRQGRRSHARRFAAGTDLETSDCSSTVITMGKRSGTMLPSDRPLCMRGASPFKTCAKGETPPSMRKMMRVAPEQCEANSQRHP